MENDNIKELLTQLDSVLGNTDLENLNTYSELPEGYYLSEVQKAGLAISKSSGNLQAAFTFNVVEDGLKVEADENGDAVFAQVKNSKNRKIFKYYPLNLPEKVQSFVRDMLKFEGEEEGKPLLGKEYFTNHELLEAALDALVGSRIYIYISTSKNADGTTSNWTNIIGWDRVKKLELPM